MPAYFLPSYRIQNNGQELRMTDSQLLDIGFYTCLAVNVAGNASKAFSIKVLGTVHVLRFSQLFVYTHYGHWE